MTSVLKAMNVEDVSATMDQFDKVCEDLDVTTATVEDGISGATATTTPEDQVQSLLEQVSTEAGLDLDAAFAASGEVPVGTGVGAGAGAVASGPGRAAVAAPTH